LIDTKTTEDDRNRIVLLTGFYSGAAKSILNHEAQVNVDKLYIDGGKSSDPVGHCQFVNDTIVGMLHSFPNALVSGDDWKYVSYNDPKPFQDTVIRLARECNRTLYVAGDRTWIMARHEQLSEQVSRFGEANDIVASKVLLSAIETMDMHLFACY
jgi:hypothetical protein